MIDAERIDGLLWGCAVGDSIGLPAEGMSRVRIARRWKGGWSQRLLFGRGMISDDTEHTLMVAECLARCRGEVVEFRRLLAWQLRWWFVALPPGIGLATARACVKLWLGFSPRRSGVWSAGNGPAMRSAVVGAVWWKQPALVEQFVRASTELTHTDPRAFTGALAIARCASWACSPEEARTSVGELMEVLAGCGSDEEWKGVVRKLRQAIESDTTVDGFTTLLGCERGVSGYIYQTVPVAIHAWLRHRPDFAAGIKSICDCGGDTDTVAAIGGALLGLEAGKAGIPDAWSRRLWWCPSSARRVVEIAGALQEAGRPARAFAWPALLAKNLVMFVAVVGHAIRRLVP